MKVNILRSSKTDWLVIFLVMDTRDIVKYLEQLFSELEGTKLTETTKVYFLIDAAKPVENGPVVDFPLQILEFATNPQTGKTEQRNIDIAAPDIENGFAWKEAITQIQVATKARFNALITWSHGAAIAIADKKEPTPINKLNYIRDHKNRINIFEKDKIDCDRVVEYKNALSVQRTVSGMDCLNLEQLFVSDIGDKLQNIKKGREFDIIIMCNCNMQVIDNAYNLRNITNYYFAPMGGIQLQGYDFARLINYLVKTSRTYGHKIFESPWVSWLMHFDNYLIKKIFYNGYFKGIIKELFKGYKIKAPNDHSVEAITVIRLNKASALPKLLNPICSYFIDNKEVTYPVIHDVIQNKISSFPEIDLFDVVIFLQKVSVELGSEKFSILAENLSKFVLKNFVVDKLIGERLLQSDLPLGLNCFTIYIPVDPENRLKRAFECQYLRGYLKAPFVTDTKWDEFINCFISWKNSTVQANTMPS